MQAPGPAPQWCPPARDLDALEVLRSGALDELRADGPGVPVHVAVPDDALAAGGRLHDTVEIVDTEGVPLARARVGSAADGGRALVEIDAWLGHRSGRPFERLHRGPRDLAGPASTLLIDERTDPAAVGSAAAAAAGPLRVVVLASIAADGSGRVARALRNLEQVLVDHPRTSMVVVPVDPTDPRLASAVGTAYSRGGPVTTLWGTDADAEPPRGVVLLLSGLSGSGKSTIARAVRDHVVETSDVRVTLLDGDEVRRHLSAGLTFSVADRETNIRRIGWVAAEIAHHGGLVICSPIAPFASTRADVRALVEGRGGRFALVHVATPLAECERRDRKGLYQRARAGLIPDFTGISSPYESPDDADLVIDTTEMSVEEARDRALDLLAPTFPELS